MCLTTASEERGRSSRTYGELLLLLLLLLLLFLLSCCPPIVEMLLA